MAISRIRPWAWYLIALGGALGLAVLGHRLGGDLRAPLALVGAGWACACAILAWRASDEAAREAHKAAWFWGGTTGLMLAVIASSALMKHDHLALTFANAVPFDDDNPQASSFVIGILFCVVAQFLGYLLCWIGWWASKR